MSENLEGNEPDVIKPAGTLPPLIQPHAEEPGESGDQHEAAAQSPADSSHAGHEHAPRVARSASNQPAYAPAGSGSAAAASSYASSPAAVSLKAAASSSASPSAKKPAAGAGRRPPRARRMSLSLTHVDAWSVAKVTFLLSVAGAIIQIVAAALVWLLLNVVGVFDQVTRIVSSTGLDAGGFNLGDVFSLGTVLSVVTIFSIIGVVLFTLLATIIAWLYNVVSALVGGVHMTLGDD